MNALLRREAVASLEQGGMWDIAVVGGGASGLATAMDAADRGYRTVLLEAHDFAKGTSSRSTKLVHGGVRYLEQGDIPLVLEALRERGLLHRNAPHLVHHLSFVIPRYKWWEGPFFGVGLKLYDALAGKLNLAPSRMLTRAETIERIPNVETGGLQGGVEYFDGQFDDARLAVAMMRTAVARGATCLNYFPVTGLLKDGNSLAGVMARDAETGREVAVRSHAVINATGIFSDQLRKMDDPQAVPAVQPSQGVHLVFERDFLPGDSAIMVPHTDDGRVLFVIPWQGRVLVGTTDTAMQDPAIEPRALPDEIEFILRNAARYLARDPARSDILAIFAGQRPLVRPPAADGRATKVISRNHEVLISASGLVTLVGGKWTTCRKMGQDAVNHAAAVGALPERPCSTEKLQLHGWLQPGSDQPQEFLAGYGSDAPGIAELARERPDLAEPLHPHFPVPKAVVVWAARCEMARTVEDVLSRRTRLLLLDARAAAACAPEVAHLLARELGQDGPWEATQVLKFCELAAGYLPVAAGV